VAAPPGLKQNMIETRVSAVAAVLNEMSDARPRFVLSPVCRTLKVGMAGRYHNERDDQGELKPSKDRYSHPCDALQYGMLGLGEGRKMIGLTLRTNRAACRSTRGARRCAAFRRDPARSHRDRAGALGARIPAREQGLVGAAARARAKYKHVAAYAYLPGFKAWLIYDVNMVRTSIVVVPDGDEALGYLYELTRDADLMAFKRGDGVHRFGRPGFSACGACRHCKHLIGLRSGALRPDALFRDCLARRRRAA
jgi:hypothetical protein